MSKIVTFEQAKRLKELGFDLETCTGYNTRIRVNAWYEPERYTIVKPFVFRDNFKNWNLSETHISAPTVPEALDWVREEKRVICAVDVDYFDGWYYTGKYQDMSKIDFQYTDSFDDHPLASSALLDAVLTYLEQKQKP